jgi:hypothetical protein
MSDLPFNTAQPARSNLTKVQHSIVLRGAPGNIYATENASANFPITTLSQSTDRITSAYRNRYASYIAATFKISIEAAQLETNYQLAPTMRLRNPIEADIQREPST